MKIILVRLSLAFGLLMPALAVAADPAAWCSAPRQPHRIAHDDFMQGLAHWRVEAQDSRTQVSAAAGVLDIQSPAGVSLWWHQALVGEAPDAELMIRFTATALLAPASAGPALAGRVSDLNMFWHATEADGRAPRPRNGAFASYDTLRAYYVGFGANSNTSTRLRHYNGLGARTLLAGYADTTEATPADRRGPMTAATRLLAGQPVQVQIGSRRPTPQDPVHLRWWANGRELFAWSAPAGVGAPPLLGGWFALRTTASHLQVQGFEVWACRS